MKKQVTTRVADNEIILKADFEKSDAIPAWGDPPGSGNVETSEIGKKLIEQVGSTPIVHDRERSTRIDQRVTRLLLKEEQEPTEDLTKRLLKVRKRLDQKARARRGKSTGESIGYRFGCR